MCGLVGVLGGIPSADGDEAVLRKMADSLIHRGPDDDGYWSDSSQRIGLGHRRLAVLELSSAGHQPMVSASGRFVIAFNGEIYNHLELRESLSSCALWRGNSDTETLLAAVEAWGIEGALHRSVGMFAIALWDRQSRVLTLARDRMGEKPLYYGWQGAKQVFLFGSDLKALQAHPQFSGSVDRGALCLLLRHNYIPGPYSIFQHVSKLEPGCILTISMAHPEPQVSKYWDATALARSGAHAPFTGTAGEAVDALEVLTKDAVRHQMLADVPLGAFLSGGVDSSTVVALMQIQSPRPVKTFTIGFHDAGYNEAEHAKAIARHLGTDHTELYVTDQDALKMVPGLPNLYSEPFADSTQIASALLSRLTRQHVKVALSGDAGDELFCGYERYHLTRDHWEKLSRIPVSMRALMAKCITMVSAGAWDRLATMRHGAGYAGATGQTMYRRADKLASRTAGEAYLNAVSHISNPSEWVIDGQEPPTCLNGRDVDLLGVVIMEQMMVLDAISYLPDDILAKVDRAAMGYSLETRVPFLDHRLVEFAWRLPLDIKFRDGCAKWALKEVLYRHVPRALIDRPKKGFSVPLEHWLRGSLREWAEALLDEMRLRREGFFHPGPVRKIWEAHLNGAHNWTAALWNVLMFQAWLEVQAG